MLKRLPVIVGVLTLLLAAATLRAQPLADRVPANAVVYVGWSGGAKMPAGYQGSRLQGFLQATDLGTVLGNLAAQAGEMAAAQDPHAAEMMPALSKLGQTAWKYPFAFYVVPPAADAAADAKPAAVVMWNAGGEAPAFLRQLQDAIAQGGEAAAEAGADGPPQPKQLGDFVVLASDAALKPLAEGGSSLAGGASFKAAVAQVQKDSALTLYADVEKIVAAANRAVEKGSDARAKQEWPKARDTLGLAGLKRVAWSAGFDGKDWQSQTFIDAPGPRRGLLQALDGPAVAQDTLKLVPKDAPGFAVARYDLADLLDKTRNTVAEIDPNSRAQFAQGLGQASAELGFDVEADLIRNLGAEWVVYTDRNPAGIMGLGLVLVNRLKDAGKVEAALAKLEAKAQASAGEGGPQVHAQVVERDGLKIHTIATPFASPSWVVKDGRFFLATTPQGVSSAVKQATAGQGSILENPKFSAMRQRLGGPQAGSLSFTDLEATAPPMYGTYSMLVQMAAGFAGPMAAGLSLPPLDAIQPHLAPAGEVSWTDNAGYHAKSIVPFPGARLLSPQGLLSVSKLSFVAGVALPAIGAAKRTAMQMQERNAAQEQRELNMDDEESEEAVPQAPASPPAPGSRSATPAPGGATTRPSAPAAPRSR